jgi:dihydropteroate synthase
MIPRVISFSGHSDIIQELRNIRVDEYGIKIMSPKADFFLIKIGKLPSMSANILKQEMLSLGGDVAISRNSITGKDKNTACLLMGNLAQLKKLIVKLKIQPFSLRETGKDLDRVITNYSKNSFIVRCGDYTLRIKNRTLLMGIINITDDSFSGDGLLLKRSGVNSEDIGRLVLENVEQMVKEGADVIDIGAESSRPGSKPIDSAEEIRRISLCLKLLVKRIKVPISVDTHKPEVAKVALDLGASIINDITGLRNKKMIKLLSRYKAGIVIMHMKGMPRTMQKHPEYCNLMEEIISFLSYAIESAVEFGISSDRIIIDPGIGFGKALEHNLEILKNLKEFKVLGRPILLGVSRKSFIGKILKAEPRNRVFGTAAAVAMSIQLGANILRVHDVKEIKETAAVCDAIINNKLTKYN